MTELGVPLLAAAPTWADFAAGWPLFIRDAVLCGATAGAVLGFLGVYVVLRRMVFVTAALSQSAALGVAMAFFASITLGWNVPPLAGALLLSVLATVLFALPVDRVRLPREAVLGMAYVAAAAAAVLVGDRIAQESHDISAILFGTAVVVDRLDLALVLAISAAVTAIHVLGVRGFLFAGFDPDGARVHRLPVRALDNALWLTVAVEVSVATRALGALPVFAFALLPAAAALMATREIRAALPLAALLGGASGALGYTAAFFLGFPVGASQTLVAALIVLAAVPVRLARGRA